MVPTGDAALDALRAPGRVGVAPFEGEPVGAAAARPGTSSFCPGRMAEPPRARRFFSTRACTVVWFVMASCHSVSPGRTVTVFHGVAATGATAAWAGAARAA